MQIRNIERVLVFRELNGEVFTLEKIAREYPIDPAGTLDYYGFGEENVRHFHQKGSALNDNHRKVLDDLLASLRASDRDEMTYLFVLSPYELKGPFEFVAANMDVVRALAVQLNGYQAAARGRGKRLNVVVRYASEMNDAGGRSYQGDPCAFVPSFIAVRGVFAEHAPRILFSFSPALRADLDVPKIADYWPGDEYVDIVGATWYVHGEKQRVLGMQHVRDYFLTSLARGKPFAVDEFGGALGESDEDIYRDNDVMLEAMLHELEALALQNVTFKYGTIFLDDGKYGVDATLRFLAPCRKREDAGR